MITMSKAQIIVVFTLVFFSIFQLSLVSHPNVWSDETFYAWHAQTIAAHPDALMDPMVWEYHPPLFTTLAAPLTLALPGLESVRLLSLALGILTLILTFWLTKNLVDEKTGAIAVVLLATNPLFFGIAHRGLLDILLTLGMLLTIIGVYRWEKDRKLLPLFVGMILSLLAKRGGFLPVGVGLLLTLPGIIRNGWRKSRDIILLDVFMITVALFFIFIFRQGKDVLFTGNWMMDLVSNLQGLALLFYPLGLGIILFLILRPKLWEHRMMFGIWILVIASSALYPIWDSRHYLPMIPALCILSAAGILALWDRVRRLRIVMALVFVGIFLIPFILHFSTIHASTYFTGYSEEGKWIRENAQNSVIYDSKDRETRYYSGLELARWGGPIRMYPSDPNVFEEEIKQETKDVLAIVMDYSNHAAPTYPTDAYLLQNGFSKVASFTQKGGTIEVIRIYRFTG